MPEEIIRLDLTLTELNVVGLALAIFGQCKDEFGVDITGEAVRVLLKVYKLARATNPRSSKDEAGDKAAARIEEALNA